MTDSEKISIEKQCVRGMALCIITKKIASCFMYGDCEILKDHAPSTILLEHIEEKHENLAFLLTVMNKHTEELKQFTLIYQMINYIFMLIEVEKQNKDFIVEVNLDDYL
jgi:hypothetical protein